MNEMERLNQIEARTQESLQAMRKDPYNGFMLETLQNCATVLAGKRCDYGDDNFIKAAQIAQVLTGASFRPHYVAACLIGIKMARYSHINNSGAAIHEPVQDTIEDLINYILLMERERTKEKRQSDK